MRGHDRGDKGWFLNQPGLCTRPKTCGLGVCIPPQESGKIRKGESRSLILTLREPCRGVNSVKGVNDENQEEPSSGSSHGVGRLELNNLDFFSLRDLKVISSSIPIDM